MYSIFILFINTPFLIQQHVVTLTFNSPSKAETFVFKGSLTINS